MPVFDSDKLTRVSERMLRAAGATPEEASVVASSLIKANLYGVDPHGLGNLTIHIDLIERRRIGPNALIEVSKESQTTTLINATGVSGKSQPEKPPNW